ncbi:hypothetical protein Tsubulata_008691 [Turnera subulata]|uniref:Protein FLX-like 2 n=1 Tax=Turnera subulata TaxID=218843 RepID=A0A9Q0J226_9ROSI|nr:hypothetical protein Tsubulata_008691 [Turnera subulata]
MGSKGRIPPPHLRRPPLGHGMVHPDPFGPVARPPMPGPFPHFDMVPPPEVMEQKIAAQHVEIRRLATENQRLLNTHGTLRQELAAAQHELQTLHAHLDALKAEREQQMRGMLEKIAKMEGELKGGDSVRVELQKAQGEAGKLDAARQELLAQVHQLNQELHRAHTEVQQIPIMMAELDNLRQEYQRCRASYDYEKKLFNDHLESLQGMEKNYLTMSKEVEKLRTELTKTASVDMRAVAGGPYGGTLTNNETEAFARPMGQTMYEDGYAVPQGQGNTALPSSNSGAAANVSAPANPGASTSAPTHFGAQSGGGPAKPGYDALRGPGYEAPKGPGFDASRGPGYDPQRAYIYGHQRGPAYDFQRGPNYDAHRGPAYDPQRVPGYDVQREPGYDAQWLPGYDPSGGFSYDAAARGVPGQHGPVAPASNLPYGSATPPTRAGSGYEGPPRSANPVKR